MAVDIPLLRRRRVFAAKVETTTGTAISLSGTDGAFNAFEPEITPDIPFNRREGQGASIDPITGVPGARGAKVKLMTDAYGAATVPSWGVLLQAAGALLTSRTYTFPTANINDTTLTMGFYQDGWLFQAAGCKLNWNLKGQNGQPAISTWEGTGLWQPPTAVALIAPTYPTTIPPRVASMTLTIGGNTYKVSDFELDLGNEVVYREDVTDVTGYHAAAITNRNITFKVSPERVALGTQDWYAAYLAGTEVALNLVLGLSANNIITITAPKLQQAAPPEAGERNGIQVDNLTFEANRSAAAGDDAVQAVFS
jgi:hypothetical protein